jgi:quinol monooxygenase YgiN
MISLTAIIRAKPGAGATVRDALIAVAEHVRRAEPDTIGYFVTEVPGDPGLFLTYERFVDAAAMERHNNGEGSKAFFAKTESLLAEVTIHTGTEAAAATS